MKDKLFATFRNSENPRLPLDTLVATLTVIDNTVPISNDRKGKIIFFPEQIYIFPNPVHKTDDKVINFSLVTPLKVRSVEISVFDAVGNHIINIPEYSLNQHNGNYHLGSWNLSTQTGRQIHSGSYLAIFTITDEKGHKSRLEKVIGIDR